MLGRHGNCALAAVRHRACQGWPLARPQAGATLGIHGRRREGDSLGSIEPPTGTRPVSARGLNAGQRPYAGLLAPARNIDPDSDEYRALVDAEEQRIKRRKRDDAREYTPENEHGERGSKPQIRRPVNRKSWTKHKHWFWMARASDPNVDAYIRIVAFAYGTDKANGHINVAPGQLEQLLGISDRGVRKAIARAVESGLLGKGSGSRCLIIPGREKIVRANVLELAPIFGGVEGDPFGRCEVCKSA